MHREMNHDAKLPTNHHSCKKQTWSFVNDHKRPQTTTKGHKKDKNK